MMPSMWSGTGLFLISGYVFRYYLLFLYLYVVPHSFECYMQCNVYVDLVPFSFNHALHHVR